MNEKYVAGVGGGLILVSFLIIILFPVFEGVKDKVLIENGTPGFSQLKAIKDEAKVKIGNNTMVEEFRELVGNVSQNMKEQITVGVNQTSPKN